MTPPVPFDFRQPPPGTQERQIGEWLQQASRYLAQSMGQLLPFSVHAQAGPVEAGTFTQLAAPVPPEAFCYPLLVQSAPNDTAWLLVPPALLLALVAGLVGETPQDWPANRPPTDLETALITYLLQQALVPPLQQAWPEPPLSLQLAPATSLRQVLRRHGTQLAWRASWVVSVPWGEQALWLCLPRQGIWEQLGALPQQPSPAPLATPWQSSLQNLVQRFPVEVTIILGETETTMKRLAELKVGDVVVLRQPVNQPLQGRIGGVPKFRAWPGMRGSRTAVLIEAITASDSDT